MTTIWQDIKYGFRMLRKNPGFTIIAMLTLALGIGATTAIVSVVKITVFDPLPVSHPDRFLELGHVDKERGWSEGVYNSVLRDAQQQTSLFAHVAAYNLDELTLPGEDFPKTVPGVCVTTEFFHLWRVQPLLGRNLFTADEGQPGKDDVLVISHRLWQREFGGDPAIIGRTVFFRKRQMTVVGIMPPHFFFPDAYHEYWRPAEDPDPAQNPNLQYAPNLRVIAEMPPGVAAAEVQAFLDVLTGRQDQARLYGSISLQARDLREKFVAPEVRCTFGLLLGASIFVLLIAASNVANLQSARMETRKQELAIRTALGAGRVRVFRQLLTESLLLALFGGTAGLAVSASGFVLLRQLIPTDLPRLKPITFDMGALGIASVVTLSAGLLFGLVPALRGWRSSLSEVLKQGEVTGTRDRGRRRFSQALIAGQLALAVVLLAGAGLMMRSVIGLLRVNPGLDPKHVVRVYPRILELQSRQYNPNSALDRQAEAAFAFFADARQRVAAIPGVTAVGVGSGGGGVEASVIPCSPPTLLTKYWVGVEEANPLRVLRVPLKQGRWLDRSDTGEGLCSILVNETAARRLWPGQAAVGKMFKTKEWFTDVAYEVVGVVGDTRDYSRHVAPQPTFYQAMYKARGPSVLSGGKFLVVRTAVDPVTLYRPIGQSLKAAGADLKMPTFLNLQEELCTNMGAHHALMLYLSIFAGVGLFLAAFGLYGVLAYSVARRTREIGIRMALGAQIGDVMRLIMRQGLALVILGGVLGIAVALATGRVLRAYLFGVSSVDPLTIIAIVLLLAGVALLACYIPARRAAKIDPMEALRYE
jgi:putative ABC transport system permease protein